MTEIEVYQPRAEVAVPDGHDTDSWVKVVSDVIKISNVIYDTPFVPDGLRGSAPAVAAAILAGREMGIGPMTSLQHIHVIKGKPAQSALLMRALIQSAGHKWEDGDVTDTRAVVRGCRRGEAGWTEVTFTADQAKKAGIDLGKYPADKLYARATSRLARRKFADVIAGMPYTAEELEDGEAAEGTVTETAPAAAIPAAAAPAENGKPRTAQRARKARTETASPAQPPPTPPAAPGPPSSAGEASLPPLPGEEDVPSGEGTRKSGSAQRATGSLSGTEGAKAQEPPAATPDDTDYDTPGTVTTPQITAIWTVLSNVYKFSSDEKEQARAVCAHIVDHDLASTKDLSKNEAKAILDTLGHWGHAATTSGDHPRDYLIATMAAQEEARDGEAPGGE